jgi:hypothetical protein
MPNVSKIVGLVIHVRDGRAVPYLINLDKGWTSAQRAYAQREAMRESKIKLGDEGCWAFPVPVDLPPAAEIVAASHAQHVAELAQRELATATGGEQIAARRADGMVEWRDAGAIPPGPQPLEAMLWEAIQVANDRDELSRLFEQASATGVEWAGPIAEAGIARARIVECVQRAMHNPATTGKCACGWTRDAKP